MMRILVILFAVLCLSGCTDYGKCLTEHEEKYDWVQQIWIGNIQVGNVSIPQYMYVPQTGIRTVCDQWEFPEGRK